jgi:hypothetical protein
MPANRFLALQSSSTKAPRIVISTHKRELQPEEINQLLVNVGLPPRDPDKLMVALSHSLLCVSARLLKDKRLVGFARASGDGVFNVTIWDFLVDPQLVDREATKRLLLERLKREIKRSVPYCSVSIFAQFRDLSLLYQANFAEDEKGIRAMILRDDTLSKWKDRLMKLSPL